MAQTTQEQVELGAPSPAAFHSGLSRGRLVLVVISVMLGMLLGSLDQTIVGTAMPRVIADLNGLEHYAWVFTAYMLASTVMVPIYGKLSDIYGRKPFFLGGMALFLLGSALSGTSQTMPQLVAFRAVQGLGAGAMLPIVQAIIGDIFPPAERGKWQGVMMSVFGLSSIVGPTLGGWITDNWGWRWTFYVNMPVGLLAFLAGMFFLPSVGRRQRHQVDYAGAALLVAAAVPMLLAFTWGGIQYAWGSEQIVGLLAFSAIAWVVFFVVEARSAEPIISPRLFQNRIFTVSVVSTFLVSVGMFGAIMYLPLFIQAVIGASATNSGTALTPMMLGFIVSSIIGGQILSRTGRYKILALTGLAVAGLGMYLLSQMDATTTQLVVMRDMVITGLGLGVMMSLFTIVVQNAFPLRQIGQVTASLQFFRSIGGTIGVAILGTVMTNRFQDSLRANLPASLTQAVPPDRLAAFQNPQVLLSPTTTAQIRQSFDALGPTGQALFQQLTDALKLSLSEAIAGLFLVSLVAVALAFVATLFLKEIPLRKSNHPTEAPAEQSARVSERAA
jgi:EmrB/QacA subfamily drug resistance transporter